MDNNYTRLIKDVPKGIKRVIFSRTGIVVLLLLLQVFTLFAIFRWMMDFLVQAVVVVAAITIMAVLAVFNSDRDPTAKMTWLLVMMVVPVFGIPFYFYTKYDWTYRDTKKRLYNLNILTYKEIPQNPEVLESIKERTADVYGIYQYVNKTGCYPVYENTEVTYFPLGEDKYVKMIEDLKRAEKFIFLEYFIIDEGMMWGSILDILKEKVKEGVEVRVMYDGTCEFSTLTRDYSQRLSKLGIKAKVWAKFTPFLSTQYNYRDHRKILVVDGKVGYTGGVNLADEYINRIERFGHWKDTAIRLEGEAVKSLTLMFLSMWNIDETYPFFRDYLIDYKKEAKGYVLPYGDSPLDNQKVGESIYTDILNRAHKYVYIMSPYLILDREMETALRFAAERGVDVRLILPGIPDKRIAYAIAKTHYETLLKSGVKIYEYTPGFIHAKVFLSDDIKAVVGTINLDYRSLYHHFECAAYLYDVPCIKDIKYDFYVTLDKSQLVDNNTIKNTKLFYKIVGPIAKIIAPLM